MKFRNLEINFQFCDVVVLLIWSSIEGKLRHGAKAYCPTLVRKTSAPPNPVFLTEFFDLYVQGMRWKLRNGLPRNSLGLARRSSIPKRSSVQPVQRVSEGLKERFLDLLRVVKEDLGSQGVLKNDKGTCYDSSGPDELRHNPWQHVRLAYNQSTLFAPFRPAKRSLGSPRLVPQYRGGSKFRRLWDAIDVANQSARIIQRKARSPNREYPVKLSAETSNGYRYVYLMLPGRKLLILQRRKRFTLRRRKRRIEFGQQPTTAKSVILAAFYSQLTPTVQRALRLTWSPLGERLYYFKGGRLRIQKEDLSAGLQALAEKLEQLSSKNGLDTSQISITDSRTISSSNFAAGEIQASTLPDKRWQVLAHGLPLSPLMNPSLIAARERRRSPKLLPSKDVSGYERKLVKCPYGKDHRTPLIIPNLANVFDSTSVSHPGPCMFSYWYPASKFLSYWIWLDEAPRDVCAMVSTIGTFRRSFRFTLS